MKFVCSYQRLCFFLRLAICNFSAMRFLFYIFLSLPIGLSACTCVFTEYFCDYTESYLEWSPDSVVVMRGRFQEFRTPDVSGYFPLFDFQVVEVLVGDFSAPFVSLLGQDGANCNGPYPYNTELVRGQEYVVLFSNRKGYFSAYGINDFQNQYPIYDYPGCGDATLEVRNGKVEGNISAGTSSVSIREFSGLLGDCLGMETNSSGYLSEVNRYEASVYPNPATDQFKVDFSKPTPVLNVSLYDVAGRLISREELDGSPINEHIVDVNRLPAGVYQLVIETDGVRVRKQVMVL